MPNSMRTYVAQQIERLIDNRRAKITPALLRDVLTQILEPVLQVAETRGSVANSEKVDGSIPTTVPGAGNVQLPPPDSPQPETGGNYNSYVQVPMGAGVTSAGIIHNATYGGMEILIDGIYVLNHAWVGASASASNDVVAFTVAVLRDGMWYFEQSTIGTRLVTAGEPVNLSGGGYLDPLLAGDIVVVWVAAEKGGTINVGDAAVGINLQQPLYN